MSHPTTPERFQRMEELFHQVQALPTAERNGFLEATCNGDAELKAEVESLLAASDDEGQASVPPAAKDEKADPRVGRVFGNYRVDSPLGRGGMGVVYLASRIGGDITQQVALKVVGSRLVTNMLRERFKSERQILASLHHPNIAQLLDGGISEGGELFLVMEYVDGPRLDHYVELHKPDPPTLLRLFLQVCDAVGYAHRNLVVHRDLKPANILMTADGQAKLLDFGTAKLVDPKSADERSRYTQMGFRAYTPEYASPEQLAGGVASAASDVYSLGVVLYQLLTNRPPHEFAPGSQYLEIIRNRTPRAPSQLRQGVGADLDAVVLKALAMVPEERYLSVDLFAADLRNVLESRPVTAREQTWGYRLLRMLRRRRLEFAGAAMVAVALGGGLAAIRAASRVARMEEQRAMQGVSDVRSLTRSLLFEFYDAVRALPGSTDVQRALVMESLTYLDKLRHDAPGDATLTSDVIEALCRLGNLQSESLHEPDAAEKTLRKAATLARTERTSQLIVLAEGSLGRALVRAGKTEEGMPMLRSATANMSQLLSSAGSNVALMIECATLHGFLGNLLLPSDRTAAEVQFTSQRELDKRALALTPASESARQDLAGAQLQLAGLIPNKEEAIALLRSGLQVLNEGATLTGSSTGTMRVRAALLLRLALALGDTPEALDFARQARQHFVSAAALEPTSDQNQSAVASADRIIARLGGSSGQSPATR
jgi:predicted Ser/Thr protein kinase/tetratricopeptide (TPR) repeat protein